MCPPSRPRAASRLLLVSILGVPECTRSRHDPGARLRAARGDVAHRLDQEPDPVRLEHVARPGWRKGVRGRSVVRRRPPAIRSSPRRRKPAARSSAVTGSKCCHVPVPRLMRNGLRPVGLRDPAPASSCGTTVAARPGFRSGRRRVVGQSGRRRHPIRGRTRRGAAHRSPVPPGAVSACHRARPAGTDRACRVPGPPPAPTVGRWQPVRGERETPGRARAHGPARGLRGAPLPGRRGSCGAPAPLGLHLPSSSSRCSRAPTWLRTTSCASRTATVDSSRAARAEVRPPP